jgi:hypothetical protein
MIRNIYETFDSWLGTHYNPSIYGEFYSQTKITDFTQSDDGTGIMYDASFVIDDQVIIHRRVVVNILEVLSDFGGVVYFVLIFFGTFITPISKFSFVLAYL